MVDFRYHLVSIIAVFLALAVGLVVGATTINEPLFDTLNSRVTSLTSDRDTLRSDNDTMARRLESNTAYAKAVLPYAVSGRLTGQQVVVVSAPESPVTVRESVENALTTAGATVTGRVEVTKKFLDPTQDGVLRDVASRVVNGQPAPESTPLQHAANQLSIALATRTAQPSLGGGTNPETKRVLALFEEAELVSVDGDGPPRSSIVLVIAPPPPEQPPAEGESAVRAFNEVIAALARQANAVVAVSPLGGAADGGVLASLRRDESLADDVSTVDHADTPAGQAAVVFAVVERLRAAAVDPTAEPASAGHYGEGPGAAKPLPDPADVS